MMKRMESEAVLRFSIYISFKLGLLIFKFQSFENVRDLLVHIMEDLEKEHKVICSIRINQQDISEQDVYFSELKSK